MGTKLYVGNLSFNTTENELQELFSQAGAVQEVTLMQDKFTGKSRGFAFVTMGSEADAQTAITKFNGQTIEGRPLTVNEARPREARPPGGGGGGGGGRGYGGGGGGYGGGGDDAVINFFPRSARLGGRFLFSDVSSANFELVTAAITR